MWGPTFDLDGAEATKVFVCRNGHAATTKEIRMPGGSKMVDLLEKAAKALDIESPEIAFYSNGVECTDVDHLVDHEVLHISCGEPFRESKGGGGGAGMQMAGNFILHEKLGEGGFGSVVKGVHSETGDLAAVKFIAKKSMRQLSDLHRVFSEIQSLRNLKHPHVISIIDVVEHPDAIVFIMEYAGGGELRNYVEKNGPLNEEDSRVFFKQVVRAVHYVHSKKIIHRDLKLENILLDKESRCKIVDFGLADYVSSNQRTVTDAGTEAYLAPEVLMGTSGDSDPYKIDVWSLGVILYALAHKLLPFARADPETCATLDEKGPGFRSGISERFRRLDREMLTPCPVRRASVDAIITDTWVAGRRFAHSSSLSADGPDSDGSAEGAHSPVAGEEEEEAAEGRPRLEGEDEADAEPAGDQPASGGAEGGRGGPRKASSTRRKAQPSHTVGVEVAAAPSPRGPRAARAARGARTDSYPHSPVSPGAAGSRAASGSKANRRSGPGSGSQKH